MDIIRNIINSDLSLIKEFRDETVNFLKQMDFKDSMIFKIRLVLDELIINSYKHGNKKDFDKLIDITLLFDEDYCMIKIKDQGEGIDYSKDRNMLSDHGRGIQLVYSLADNFFVMNNTIVAFLKLNESEDI